MGGGKEKKAANQLIDRQREQQHREHTQAHGQGLADITQSAGRQEEGRAGLLSSLDYQPDSISAERLGSFSPISARSVTARTIGDPGKLDLGQGRQRYQNFIDTGGVDIGAMRAGQDKLGGGGVFEEFAKTGGLDEGARANIRQRATSVIPGFYQRMRDESERLGSVQGGYGPGRMALASRLARGEAAGAQDAALNAELGINQQVMEGRRFGAEGIQRHGQLLNASEQTAQETSQRGKMFGTEGWAGSEESEQSQNVRNALEAEMFNARQHASAEALNAQLGSQADTFNSESGMRSGMFNASNALEASRANQAVRESAAGRRTSALSSLYGTDVGAAESMRNRMVDERGMTYGAQRDITDQRMRNNPRRDWWGTATNLIGSVTGAGAGLAGR